jgi:hypothetical protein
MTGVRIASPNRRFEPGFPLIRGHYTFTRGVVLVQDADLVHVDVSVMPVAILFREHGYSAAHMYDNSLFSGHGCTYALCSFSVT